MKFFFNSFFVDKGPYKDFVSSSDERLGDKFRRDRMKAGKSVTNSAVVRVLVPQLKDYLRSNSILK